MSFRTRILLVVVPALFVGFAVAAVLMSVAAPQMPRSDVAPILIRGLIIGLVTGIATAVVLVSITTARVTAHLRRLTSTADRYRRGDFSSASPEYGDDELATVKESVEKGTITWPVWWDGGRPGPIAKRWNVSAWPETYIFDHKGVIRYRELPSEVLAIAVSRLVREAGQARSSSSTKAAP